MSNLLSGLIDFSPRYAVRSEEVFAWLHSCLYWHEGRQLHPFIDYFLAEIPQKFPRLFQLKSLCFYSATFYVLIVSSSPLKSRKGLVEPFLRGS
jgi:hypothetical protein